MRMRWLFLSGILLIGLPAFAIELINIKQHVTGQELVITPEFDLKLTDEIKEALNSGIVITFVAQAKLMEEVDWWFDGAINSKIQTFKLRYFSLSRQFQLNNISQKQIQTFVTLDLLLKDLSTKTEFIFPVSTGADYIQTRLFLDKQALPSTMQLPIVFDQDWNINSNWQKAQINVSKVAETP